MRLEDIISIHGRCEERAEGVLSRWGWEKYLEKVDSDERERVRCALLSFYSSFISITGRFKEVSPAFNIKDECREYGRVYALNKGAEAALDELTENLFDIPADNSELYLGYFRLGDYSDEKVMGRMIRYTLSAIGNPRGDIDMMSFLSSMVSLSNSYLEDRGSIKEMLEDDEFHIDSPKRKACDDPQKEDIIPDTESISIKISDTAAAKEDTGKTAAAYGSRYDMGRVIGNEEAVRAIRGIINSISLCSAGENTPKRGVDSRNAGYNVTPKQNSLLLVGRPGCGKTLLVKEARRYGEYAASIKGVPFNYAMIDNGFKDKYHGEDIKNLEKIVDRVKGQRGIGLLIADDVDGVFKKRSDSDNDFDGQIVHYFLQLLDGADNDYTGNYAMIMTTNFVERLDSALVNRFSRIIKVEGPKSVGDYEKILRYELGEDITMVQEGSITRYAEMMKDRRFNGRDISNVVSNIHREINRIGDYDVREIILGGADYRKRIDKRRVMGIIEDYSRSLKEEEAQSYEDSVNAAARRIRIEKDARMRV